MSDLQELFKEEENIVHYRRIAQFNPGDKVIFIGSCKEQVKWGNNSDPTGILTEGNTYIVEKEEVHSWHTKLYLEGIVGKFNSVSFEKAS